MENCPSGKDAGVLEMMIQLPIKIIPGSTTFLRLYFQEWQSRRHCSDSALGISRSGHSRWIFPVTTSNTPQVRSHGFLYLQKLASAAYCNPLMMNYANCFAISGSFFAIQVTFFLCSYSCFFVLLEEQWIFKEKLPTAKKDIKGEKSWEP